MPWEPPVQIICDRCGFSDPGARYGDADQARRYARKAGWKIRPGMDLCAKCRKKVEEGSAEPTSEQGAARAAK